MVEVHVTWSRLMLRRRGATAALAAWKRPWWRQLLPTAPELLRNHQSSHRRLWTSPVLAAARAHDTQVDSTKRAPSRSTRSNSVPRDGPTRKLSLADFPADHAEFWTGHLKRCTRDGALRMLHWIDTSNPLGVDTSRKGVNTDSKDSVYGVTLSTKHEWPVNVILVRVGEFYEAMGYDAVMLVQYAGLNPMGSQPYKAGTPVVNIHSTLKCLTDAGFSVTIVEEVPERITYGQKPPTKERMLSGVVTPASPQYIYNAVASSSAADGYDTTPTLGLLPDASGAFSLATVNTDLRSYSVIGALPEASVVAFLRAMPMAMLYTHQGLRRLPGMATAISSTPLGGAKSHAGAALRNALDMHEGCVESFGDVERNALGDLLERVRRANNLPPDTQFTRHALSDAGGTPRPLALSTALSLGVVHSINTPDLVRSLLPSGSPRAVVHAMRSLLLCPPGEKVADELALALRAVAACDESIPHLPLLPAAQVARLVNAGECSAPMFRKLVTLCRRFLEFNGTAKLRAIAEALLTPASLESGVVMGVQELADKCARSIQVIDAVVVPEHSDVGSGADDETRQAPADVSQMIGSRLNDGGSGDSQPWPTDDSPIPQHNVLPLELFESNERSFRGLVRSARVEDALRDLADASSELNSAVRDDFLPVLGQKVYIAYDYDNNAVWLRLSKESPLLSKGAPENHGLVHPRDKRGRRMEDTVLSSERVETAMEQYRQASRSASDAVFAALRGVSSTLVSQQLLIGVVGAAAFSLWLRLALDHTNECGSLQGWTLPQLVPVDQPWVVAGLTPPWLPRHGAGAARANDFTCDGLLVLTGANMAGKSTVMRSAGACALLANCGLYVPADTALVPRFKAFHVRMASSDNPLMSLSHWGLDMAEAIAAVEAANSLKRGACILLDELGQGTEVSHAGAMAAALIRALNESRCRGMFATHLHGVLPLVSGLPGITMKCMEIEAGRPTWRMVDGASTQSLAFQVAQDLGMPASITTYAQQYLQTIAAEHADTSTTSQFHATDAATLSTATHVPVDVIAVLKDQVAAVVASDSDIWMQTFTVQAGHVAPPLHNRCPAVYAFQHESRWYIGETVSLVDRMQAHRSRYGAQLAFTYALVPDESKAKMVETNTQRQLKAKRVHLLSDADATHKPVRDA